LYLICDDADIDECAENNGGCHAQAVCNNTEGSFTCTCNPGYTGDGFNCTGMSNYSKDFYVDLRLEIDSPVH